MDATPERAALNDMEYAYKKHGISSFQLPIIPIPINAINDEEIIDVDQEHDLGSIQLRVTSLHITAINADETFNVDHKNDPRLHSRSPVHSSDKSALKKTKYVAENVPQMSTPSTKRKLTWAATVRTPPTKTTIVSTSTIERNFVKFRFSYKPSRDCKTDPLINMFTKC